MKKSEIYLAGGCFWGTQHYFKQIKGILSTEVGYANGNTPDPTYEQVCFSNTGYAEAVKLIYNAEEIALAEILELYFKTINPTSFNRQGNDIGEQYRTGIYFTNPSDEPIIEKALNELSNQYMDPIEVESQALRNFYPAEDYHQDYIEKRNGASSCNR